MDIYTYQCRYRYRFRYKFIAFFCFTEKKASEPEMEKSVKLYINFKTTKKDALGAAGMNSSLLFLLPPRLPQSQAMAVCSLVHKQQCTVLPSILIFFAKPQNLLLYTLWSTVFAPRTSFCASRYLNNYTVWFPGFLYASWIFSDTGRAKDYFWENIHQNAYHATVSNASVVIHYLPPAHLCTSTR